VLVISTAAFSMVSIRLEAVVKLNRKSIFASLARNAGPTLVEQRSRAAPKVFEN
jgi:hypothetical protein